jgi:hypothetical protein
VAGLGLSVALTRLLIERDLNGPVGVEYSATLCDLGIFVYQPAEPISADDLEIGVDRVR